VRTRPRTSRFNTIDLSCISVRDQSLLTLMRPTSHGTVGDVYVLLQCLDPSGAPITGAHGSGFVLRENGILFLYTCWHVATGYDRSNIEIRRFAPNPLRASVKVLLQNSEKKPGIETIGRSREFTVPLYDATVTPPRPLWYQDEQDIPHEDLNHIGLRVPLWHDAIKLPLPANLELSDSQVIEKEEVITPDTAPELGDKVLIVGYPYGFSSQGLDMPTPIVLTRFIASMQLANRKQELLLESFGQGDGLEALSSLISLGTEILLDIGRLRGNERVRCSALLLK
jgi:hypothetical protein